MNENNIPVSVSRVTTHSICPRRFYYKYERGLEQAVVGVSPRVLGLVVHEVLAFALKQYHLGGNQFLARPALLTIVTQAAYLWDKENRPDLYAQFVDDEGVVVRQLDLERYNEWHEMLEKARDISLRTLIELDIPRTYIVASDAEGKPLVEYELEHQWQVESNSFVGATMPYLFRGRLDVVLESVDFGYRVLVDFKTKGGSYRTEEGEALAAQIGLYQHVLWLAHGIHTPIGLLFQIKARSPETPTLNKNGTMSRRKLVSTWEVYEDALLKAGLDPNEYEEEMRPKLAAVEWFRKTEVVRTGTITQRVWNNFQEQVYHMNRDTTYPRVLSPTTCQGCAFNTLCNAWLYGHDEDAIIEEQYEQCPAEGALFSTGPLANPLYLVHHKEE